VPGKQLTWIVTPATAWTLFVGTVSVFGAVFLNPAWAVDDGPIENLQIAVLLLNCFIAAGAYYKGHGSLARRRLYLLSIPAWLLMVGRELSWGRVFFPDGSGGFLALRQLPFGQFVYPAISVIVIGIIYYMVSNGLHKELYDWIKHGNFPILDIVLFIGTALMADMFEHHSHGLFGDREELYEELSELVAYTAMMTTLINLTFDHHFGLYRRSESS